VALHEADLESVRAAEENVATLEDVLGRSKRETAAAKHELEIALSALEEKSDALANRAEIDVGGKFFCMTATRSMVSRPCKG